MRVRLVEGQPYLAVDTDQACKGPALPGCSPLVVQSVHHAVRQHYACFSRPRVPRKSHLRLLLLAVLLFFLVYFSPFSSNVAQSFLYIVSIAGTRTKQLPVIARELLSSMCTIL